LMTPNVGAGSRFNPAGGLFGYTLPGNGSFDVALGVTPASAGDDIAINVSAAPPGTYTAQIVLTLVQH